MKMVIEEYGIVIVSSVLGITIMGLGIGILEMMKPVLEIYISFLM